MSRYGVVDVGSNTIHLLVGEVDGGEVLPVTGEKFSARLGAGVEKTGRLEEERLLLAAEAINFFARIAALNGAPSPEVLATSAVRDAKNGAELVERGAVALPPEQLARVLLGDTPLEETR